RHRARAQAVLPAVCHTRLARVHARFCREAAAQLRGPLSMSDAVLVESQAGVQTLTLNQPSRLNALSVEMLQALNELLRAAERDPAVRAVVLTGAGKAFSSGADITEFSFDSQPPDVGDLLRRRVNP